MLQTKDNKSMSLHVDDVKHLALVVPVLNEAENLDRLLPQLRKLMEASIIQFHPVFIDGGSSDHSVEIIERFGLKVIHSKQGRALQMQAGVDYFFHHSKQSDIDGWIFLHADTCHLEPSIFFELRQRLHTDFVWGFASLYLDDTSWIYRLIGTGIRLRSKWFGVATGDQMIFVSAKLFKKVHGLPQLPLMEDIEFTRRLRRRALPEILNAKIIVSSRRWKKHGVVKTVLLMWWLQLRFRLGADPHQLYRDYYGR